MDIMHHQAESHIRVGTLNQQLLEQVAREIFARYDKTEYRLHIREVLSLGETLWETFFPNYPDFSSQQKRRMVQEVAGHRLCPT